MERLNIYIYIYIVIVIINNLFKSFNIQREGEINGRKWLYMRFDMMHADKANMVILMSVVGWE